MSTPSNIIADLKILLPREFSLETGRLLELLATHPDGVKKCKLLTLFYTDYIKSSELRKGCLETNLNKLLQRTRKRFKKYGINVHYCAIQRQWQLISLTEAVAPSTSPVWSNIQEEHECWLPFQEQVSNVFADNIGKSAFYSPASVQFGQKAAPSLQVYPA